MEVRWEEGRWLASPILCFIVNVVVVVEVNDDGGNDDARFSAGAAVSWWSSGSSSIKGEDHLRVLFSPQ